MPSDTDSFAPVIPNKEGESFDLAIIGAGPTGLYAGFYAGLRSLRTIVIDCQSVVGGQLTTLYPSKIIYDSPGMAAVQAQDLVSDLAEQTELAQPTYSLSCLIHGIQKKAGSWLLSSHKQSIRAKTILIATGAGTISPKPLSVSRAAQWEGKGLHYVLPAPETFRQRRVMIFGAGQELSDMAMKLKTMASHVISVSRLGIYDALEVAPLSHLCQTETYTGYEVTDLVGTDQLQAVTLTNKAGTEIVTVPVDDLIVLNGYDISMQSILNWDVNTDKGGIVVDSRMQTSQTGIYAAGDIASYLGKLRLIASGFAEAATAVNHAKQFVDPTAPLFPGHSTSVAVKRLVGLRKRSQP